MTRKFSKDKLSRLNRALLYILLFGIPLFVLSVDFNEKPVFLIYFPAKYFLWGIFLSFMLILSFFDEERLKWKTSHSIPLAIPLVFLFLFWAWMLVSFLWSINRYQTLESFTQWSFVIVTTFFIARMVKKQSHVKKVFWACILSVSIATLISFLQAYADIFIVYYIMGFKHSSTFANYNFITHYSIIALPLFIPLFLWAKSAKEKLCLLGMLLLQLSYFILLGSSSRAFLLGLVIDAGMLLFLCLRKIPHFKKISASVILLLIVIAGYKGVLSYKNMSPQNAMSTTQQRWIMWRNTLEAIKDKPFFGTGLGTFPIVYEKYEEPQDRALYPMDKAWSHYTRQAHNDFLQIFQELGAVGFLFFLLFLTMLITKSIHIFLRSQNREQKILLFSLFLSLANFLIISLVYFPFHEPMSSSLFCVITGLLMGKFIQDSDFVNRFSFRPSSPEKILAGFSALLLASFFLINSVRYFLCEWHWKKIDHQMEIVEAEKEIEKSLFWNGKDWEKLFAAANFYLRQDKFHRSKELFTEASRLSPYSAKIFYNLAVVYSNLDEKNKALAYLEASLKLGPDFMPSYHLMGILLHNRGEVKKALRFFKKAQTPVNPFQDLSYYMSAVCENRLRRGWFSKKEIMEAIALDPHKLRYQRALALIDKKIQTPSWQSYKGEASLGDIQHRLEAKDPEILIQTLRQAQFVKNAESLLIKVFELLKHENRNVRMEATQFLHSLPETALVPLLKMYPVLKDDEVRWRVFYVISEKMPMKALSEARRIFIEKKESDMLEVLSMRLLSRYAPDDLIIFSKIGESFDHLVYYYSRN